MSRRCLAIGEELRGSADVEIFFVISELLRKEAVETVYSMGNNKSKGGQEVSEQTLLSHEEQHCSRVLFHDICRDHSACHKEDLKVSGKLWYYDLRLTSE